MFQWPLTQQGEEWKVPTPVLHQRNFHSQWTSSLETGKRGIIIQHTKNANTSYTASACVTIRVE